MDQIQLVPLEYIDRGDNDRKVFSDQYIAELADDIRRNGLTSKAITLTPSGDRYRIVEGECRTRAYRLLAAEDPERWGCIPAVVRALSDEQADNIMFAENFKRRNLDVIEEAEAYQKRIDKYGWSLRECSQQLGVPEERIRRRLKLLKLMPEAQHLVRHGNMPLGHAEAMAVLTKNFQLIAFQHLSKRKGITLEDFTKVTSELERKQNQLSLFDDQLFYDQQQVISAQIDHMLDSQPVYSTFTVQSNGCTIFAVVQHPKNKPPTVDESLLRRAIQF